MKKLIFILTILFCTSFVFTEPKFMGVSFNITEEESSEKEKLLGEKIKNALSDYCRSASVRFYYNYNKKFYRMKIFLDLYDTSYYKIIESYFLENGYKKQGYLYNQDFVVSAGYEGNTVIIEVYERSSFCEKFKTLFQ